MQEIMLKIDNVSKKYILGQIGGTTLRDELQRFSAKIHHKEDPTKRIGAKDYNKGETFLALNGVSFEVKKGERVGIIGHNGAGKSTLLKLISRITAPTEGTISMNGRVASMLEVGTGFHPELTGRENIYMNGAILGMTKKEIDSKIEEIIDFSECREFIDTPVKRYSSGMYVKLAFSVAAHLDSEILIMDEVLAVGDMAFQKKCLGKMESVSNTQGRTILYVSHNMNTIRELCNRVIVLSHGILVFDGIVEDGISVYMNVAQDIRTYFDFSEINRRFNDLKLLEMRSLNIINRETNQILRGELLQFILNVRINRDIKNVYLRIEISFADGSMAGTVFTDSGFSANSGSSLDISIDFDTTCIAPGFYSGVALLFEKDSYGNHTPIDRIEPAMTFEVLPNEGDFTWLHQYFGHTYFKDMDIKEIKRY